MAIEGSIALPVRSRELLDNLLRERERVNGLLEAALAGVRTALDVPEGWVLTSLEAGFAPPAAAAQEEGQKQA